MADRQFEQNKQKEITLESLHRLIEQRKSVFRRFPLVFTLLGTFGVVCTFYGFNKILAKIPLIAHNPYIALVIGVIILLFTGTLYKKLG